MTIRERLISFLSEKAAPLPTTNTMGGRKDTVNYASFAQQVNNGLKKNHIVQACVSKRATTLNEPPLVVVDANGNVIPDHAITKLFARPNPVMSQAQFWSYVSTYQDCGGNCYGVLVRNSLGSPIEVWPYSDGQMTPVSESGAWIDYYQYKVGQDERRIEVRDVIHFRSSLIDPLKPYKGISPIELVQAYIETTNEATETVRSVLANNGVPSTILWSTNNLQPDQREVLRTSWDQQTKGKSRGKMAVLSGTDFKVERLGQSMEELAIADMLNPYEAAICAAYNVHPSVVGLWSGLTNSTYSNLETAYREYTTLTRIPQWNAWEECVEAVFRTSFPNINLEFDLSNVEALRSDPDAIIYPVIAQYNASLVTLNEARKKMGLEATDNGDIYAVDRTPPLPTGFADAPPELMQVKEPSTYESGKIKHDEKEAVPYWNELDKAIEDASAEANKATMEMIDEAYKGIGAKSGVKKSPDEINLEFLVNKWLKSTGAVRERLLKQVLTLAMKAVGENPELVASYLDNAQKAMTQVLNENIKTAAGTIKQDIIDTVKANAGKTSEEISTAIQAKKLATQGNADRIAKTSFRASVSTAQTETWKEVNKRQTDPNKRIVKVWLTRRDNKVRPSHEKLDGQWIEMGGQFTAEDGSKLDAPAVGNTPSDVVNCRCVLRPMRYEKVKGQR